MRDISRAVLDGDVYARDADNYVSTRDCVELRARPLPAGTIVFAKIGEAIRLNRRAILAQDSLVDNNAMGALARPGLETLFLFYYLTTLKLGDLSRATTVPSVRKSDVESVQLPLAPTFEQRRIVAKIEELFSKLDAGVEELEKAKAQLKRYRQSVLKAAFEGKLTEQWRKKNLTTKPALSGVEGTPRHRETAQELLARIREERKKALGKKYKEPPPLDTSGLPELPEGWAWARLEDIISDSAIGLVRSGAEQNADRSGVPYVKMGNVTMDGDVVLDDLVCVEATGDELERYSLRDCDILFNTRNSVELVGKTGLVRSPPRGAVYNNNLMRIRLYEGVEPGLLVRQMCAPDFRHRLELVKRATTNVAAVYAKDLMPLAVAVQPTEEQKVLTDEIERRLSVTDAEEKAIDMGLAQAARLRQAILKRAFEGRLVPQDPTDEPATELLKRITEARANSQVAKKARGRQPRSH